MLGYRGVRRAVTVAAMTNTAHAPSVRIHDSVITLRVAATETGRVSAVEYDLEPWFPGPPRHIHPAFDEVFCILEGNLSLLLEDDTFEAGPGDVVHVEGSVPHTFANLTGERARLLLFMTPGGFENYFFEVAEAIAAGTPPSQATAELSRRFGVTPA